MKAKECEEKAATSSTEEPTKSKMGDQKTNLKKTRIHKKLQSIGIHLVPSVCLCEKAFYEQGKFLLHERVEFIFGATGGRAKFL